MQSADTEGGELMDTPNGLLLVRNDLEPYRRWCQVHASPILKTRSRCDQWCRLADLQNTGRLGGMDDRKRADFRQPCTGEGN